MRVMFLSSLHENDNRVPTLQSSIQKLSLHSLSRFTTRSSTMRPSRPWAALQPATVARRAATMSTAAMTKAAAVTARPELPAPRPPATAPRRSRRPSSCGSGSLSSWTRASSSKELWRSQHDVAERLRAAAADVAAICVKYTRF